MSKILRPRVVPKERLDVSRFPDEVSVALAEVAASAKQGLLALSVATGLKVMSTIFESDVTEIVGPKGKHNAERTASRHGAEDAYVTLGGRRVKIHKPRVRSVDEHEIALPSFRHFADTDDRAP